jgi:hypothetical protein
MINQFFTFFNMLTIIMRNEKYLEDTKTIINDT